MAVQLLNEKYSSKVEEVVLGATAAEGGTRTSTIKLGGETTMPFLHFEGGVPNPPAVGMEIYDIVPAWPDNVLKYFSDVVNDPAAWAKKCVDEYGAQCIHLKLLSSDPDRENASTAEQCVVTVKSVLAAVGVPLIVSGSGMNDEKDNEVLTAVAEATSGENILFGFAEQENYKSLVAACMVHKHSIISRSPLDINICKQLNILITEMGLQSSRIIIDPTSSGLGYGVEYAYSIIERARLGALQGDKMLAMPIIAFAGHESWRAKESYAPEADFPGWGNEAERAPLWEAGTAAALLQSGTQLVIMRHPEAVNLVKKNIAELMESNAY